MLWGDTSRCSEALRCLSTTTTRSPEGQHPVVLENERRRDLLGQDLVENGLRLLVSLSGVKDSVPSTYIGTYNNTAPRCSGGGGGGDGDGGGGGNGGAVGGGSVRAVKRVFGCGLVGK